MLLKKFLVNIILLLIVAMLSGCQSPQQYPISHTMITDYMERLECEVDLIGNMQHNILRYSIYSKSQNTSTVFYVRYYPDEELPQNPFESFECIVKTECINIYRLQNGYIFSDKQILAYVPDESLNDIEQYLKTTIGQIKVPEERENYKYAFEKALEAFVETKNLLYIQKCAPFLLESGNQNIKCLITKWASGSVTDDEISINAAIGYKKEDIIDWAKQFNVNTGNSV